MVADIDPAAARDLPMLCAQIGARRGRELILATVPARRGGPAAGWWHGERVDYLLVSDHLTGLHRWMVTLHGIGHVVFDHVGDTVVIDEQTRRWLLEGVDGDRVRQALPPWSYTDTEESEAEWFATWLLCLMADWAPQPPPTTREEPACSILARLATVLESPVEPSPPYRA